MHALTRDLCAAIVIVALAWPATAAQATAPQPPPAQSPAPGKQDPKKDPQKPEDQKPAEPPKYEETVVVSGSRIEQRIVNTPVTMSVITAAQIETAPSQSFAELLRIVPGLNITQVSARDVNLTSRAATGTLATGQLALLDGRSLYQDFFGFVMWDFLPVNLNEIKRIEVIRGPASAVWGANAVNGVINVITKSPREMEGTSAVLGFGTFDRTTEDNGSLWYLSATHAQAVNERWAYKLSGGAYTQEALSRPTGNIPCTFAPLCVPVRRPYPGFENTGTTQPKFDVRVDYDAPQGGTLSLSGGVAGTEGIMHSGIGPFDIEGGSTMGYAKAAFTRGGFRGAFFTNVLNGDASNLLTRTPTDDPITFDFATKTFDFEASNVHTFAARHVVNYGGNLRFNQFDLSLAPAGDDRTEFGVYGQDEIFINEHLRLSLGARVDRVDYLDDFVFSPRAAVMLKPQQDHTFRLSFNRAYRAPSVVNNFLDATIAEPVDLTPFAFVNPAVVGRIYPLPVQSVGNPDLREQSLDAWEVGYTGILADRTVLTAAFYVNRTKNEILFTEVQSARYSAANPPPNWAFGLLPPQVIAFVPGGRLPALFTYQNFGETTYRGFELGVDSRVNPYVNLFANYSFQGEPEPDGFPLSELNIPAEHRFNVGAGFNYNRFLGNLTVSYSDAAFWQDVLDARFAGTTEAYTLVNASFGYRWNDRLTTSIKTINLANDEIQQHVFGDVMKRQLIAELRVNFGR